MGHWYAQDGRPCYELPKRGGGTKAVTLRDARQLHLVPSVTTVLQVIDKPALVNWKVEQGIRAAMELRQLEWESEDAYIERCVVESGRKARDAADLGGLIHDAIECSFKGNPYPEQFEPHVRAARAELERLFPGVTDWVAEESFSHEDGFGGRVDLYSPSTGIVPDWKTKDGDFTDGKRLAYDQHIQLGAYRRGLKLPRGAPAANIFVSRTHPGAVVSHLWKPSDVDHGENIFLAALRIWKLVKDYESGYEADHRQQ